MKEQNSAQVNEQGEEVGTVKANLRAKIVKNGKPKNIRELVCRLYGTLPEIDTKVIVKEVKRYFPKSHFDETHVYWYTRKIREGYYEVSVR